jgi:hypothetical protein
LPTRRNLNLRRNIGKLGATGNTVLTLIGGGLLGGTSALTKTGRNRAATNPRENFMITEKENFLHSQGEMGYPKVGLTCVKH